ncbi:MAG: GGDEF domain-containing protein [Bacteroidia bacterium]|nr:GGDEF domain-containing protein [Bacteroidia bacterium]
MTSISNYRGFKKAINKKIKNKSEFTLAILDIDDFRKYNFKSYAFGDCVLKEFVNFLKKQLPENSFIARYKFGDEFLIIINDNLKIAEEKLNLILENCKKHVFKNVEDQTTFNIIFSFGVAGFEKNTDNLDNLLIRTEKALKEKKASIS